MKYSIITPVYNRHDTVGRCIQSVIKQDFKDYELVLVNDGSTDSTLDTISSYLPDEKIVLIDYRCNKGVNYARNRAIEDAAGEWLVFLDSDDTIIEGGLSVIHQIMRGSPGYQHYLFPTKRPVDGADQEPAEIWYERWLTGQFKGDYTHVVQSDCMTAYLFFEQFRASESLNWLRIYKNCSPQFYAPIVVQRIDESRSDHLSKVYSETNRE